MQVFFYDRKALNYLISYTNSNLDLYWDSGSLKIWRQSPNFVNIIICFHKLPYISICFTLSYTDILHTAKAGGS